MKFKFEKNIGITLIALVVSIIVLLILAGLSITMLTGQNGIIKNAISAKAQTNQSNMEEQLKLIVANEKINSYTNTTSEDNLEKELNNMGYNTLTIKWQNYIIFDLDTNDEYRITENGQIENMGQTDLGKKLKNAKMATDEQLEWDSSSSNVIGLDDEGNTVNMLRWEYTLIDSENKGQVGTYGLNDINALDSTGASGRSSGYKENYVLNGETISNYNADGTIKGKVPAYISEDGGESFIAVTSMVHTFYACDKLIKAPEIPDTITNMSITFYKSANLTAAPNRIPDSVINLDYSFANCTQLNTIPIIGKNVIDMTSSFSGTSIKTTTDIPSSVKNLQDSFQDCPMLEEAKELNTSVENLKNTFRNCPNLKNTPNVIPDSVKNLDGTFYGCSSISSVPTKIPNNVESMSSTFYGCTMLTNLPESIPSSVTNMFQTFGHCPKIQGPIEINANLKGNIVMEWNGNNYTDYDQCFSSSGTEGSGITILKSSKTPKEMLTKLVNRNSKITIEQ